ncbi:MAG: tRNA(Ile)-lysidine synthase [Methanoregula sp.]|jgi:tRNA(Ile)-lysidine synthase TilS/MesJ|uniref:tRNA(Ile)-lysidine synthase n=1 Tax=Methanoregula sp. TaxID=2052170 RepID=UPI003D0A19AD
MQCDACRREALIFQPYSGKHLCPMHFLKDFETKAKRTIRSHGWLRPGDHIAVVLPGDAAGAALLAFLVKLTADRRDIRLSAITVDTGISDNPAPEQARKVAVACGVEWLCSSFAERYGTTMDAIIQQEGREAACRSSQVLRNDLIGEIAEAHGVTRCAFATTVDDCAGTFFSGLLSGTIECTLFPSGATGKTRIPAIRPFMDIPAPEVIWYAELHPECAGCGALPPCADSDPGADDALAALDAYDRRHPATKFALANLSGTLAGIAAAQGPPPSCQECGESIDGEECEACSIRRKFDRRSVS